MVKNRIPSVALLLKLVTLATPALAEATVVRVTAPCPIEGGSMDGVLAILRAQLTPMLIEQSAGRGTDPDSIVALTVDTFGTKGGTPLVTVEYRGARQSLEIGLDDVAPSARDRTLALALAESVQHALIPRPDDDPTTRATPAPVPDSAPAAAAPVVIEKVAPGAAPSPTAQATPSGRNEPGVRSRLGPTDHASTIAWLAEPIIRHAFKTSTPYAGLESGVGVGRLDFRLRVLASERSVRDASLWQGALLGVLGADWARLTPQVSLHAEVELGAAHAAPNTGPSSSGRHATSFHGGVANYLRLESPLGSRWVLRSELGLGLASSLTSQAYSSDVMSLSGVFLQTAFGVSWGVNNQ